MDNLREKLAELAHEQWSGWMKYLFAQMEQGKYCLLMPGWAEERWKRQMRTPYAELSEQEKESDRKEADRVLALLSAPPSPGAPDRVRAALKDLVNTIDPHQWIRKSTVYKVTPELEKAVENARAALGKEQGNG